MIAKRSHPEADESSSKKSRKGLEKEQSNASWLQYRSHACSERFPSPPLSQDKSSKSNPGESNGNSTCLIVIEVVVIQLCQVQTQPESLPRAIGELHAAHQPDVDKLHCRQLEDPDPTAITLKSQSVFADPMFREMWLKREFCDLFFRAEPNKVLCAHRVVLAAHSSHLQSRLYRKEEKEKSTSTTAVGGFDDDSILGPIIELQDSQASWTTCVNVR
eukprot:765110-Hanusia_phi.AAC.10